MTIKFRDSESSSPVNSDLQVRTTASSDFSEEQLSANLYNNGREINNILRQQFSDNTVIHDINSNESSFHINANRDTAYANINSFGSEYIATMFTQQWVGIRQACGALSGHKVSIDGRHMFTDLEIFSLAERLRALNIEQVVYHGMSPATAPLLRGLKKLLPSVEFYGVWHGTMAGWNSREEVDLLRQFLKLADDYIFEKIGFLRQGMQHIHTRAYKRILYNIPPKTSLYRSKPPFNSNPIDCIFPSWNNVWKNMYTNILAAEYCNLVRSVYTYSDPDIRLFNKVKVLDFKDHESHFLRLSSIDLCLNVSINDCQPMAELEGLSVGTPSLRNDWNLDLEIASEYESIFTVRSYLNADAIIEKISEIGELGPTYISNVVIRHVDNLVKSSTLRYKEFLSR